MKSVRTVSPREAVVGQLTRHGIPSSAIDTVIFRYGIRPCILFVF